jgi:hypothetical protein
MKTAAEFKKFYEAELLPRLQQLDGQRKRAARGLVFAVLVAIGCVVALFVIGSLFEGASSFPWLGVIGAFGLFYAVYFAAVSAAKKMRSFIGDFKQIVVGRIVQFVEPGLTYSPDRMVSSKAAYAKSQLFLKPWDRYEGDDHVEGTIGQTPIRFSEVRTQLQGRGAGRRQWPPGNVETHFLGAVLPVRVQQDVSQADVCFSGQFGFLVQAPGQDSARATARRTGEIQRMDDPEFEKRFAVYGDDPVEARYVLSTSLMARMVRFHDKARLAVCLAFVDSDLYVAIEYGRELFEPRIFRTLVNYKVCLGFFEDLALVAGIVEDLNLNTRIWGERALVQEEENEHEE